MDKYLNLYRLFPKSYGLGSRASIDTKYSFRKRSFLNAEIVSFLLQKIKDSQYNWKQLKNTSHIKNLFYTFIWNFCPQLILDGHIYAGVPPLYKITTSKGYKYLKNDEELEKYRVENADRKYQVNRLKG